MIGEDANMDNKTKIKELSTALLRQLKLQSHEFFMLVMELFALGKAIANKSDTAAIKLEVRNTFINCWSFCIAVVLTIYAIIPGCHRKETGLPTSGADTLIRHEPKIKKVNLWDLHTIPRFKGKDAEGITDEMIQIAKEDAGSGDALYPSQAIGTMKSTIGRVYFIRNIALAFDRISPVAVAVYPNPTFYPQTNAKSSMMGCFDPYKIVVYSNSNLNWEYDKEVYLAFVGINTFETMSGEAVQMDCFVDLGEPYSRLYVKKIQAYNQALYAHDKEANAQDPAPSGQRSGHPSASRTPRVKTSRFEDMTSEEKEAFLRAKMQKEMQEARKKNGISK